MQGPEDEEELPNIENAREFRALSRARVRSTSVGLAPFDRREGLVGCHRIPNTDVARAYFLAREARDSVAMRGLLGLARSRVNMRNQPKAHNDNVHSARERLLRGRDEHGRAGEVNLAIKLQASRYRQAIVGALTQMKPEFRDSTLSALFKSMLRSKLSARLLAVAVKGLRFPERDLPRTAAVVKEVRDSKHKKGSVKKGESIRGRNNRGEVVKGRMKLGSKRSKSQKGKDEKEQKNKDKDEVQKGKEDEEEVKSKKEADRDENEAILGKSQEKEENQENEENLEALSEAEENELMQTLEELLEEFEEWEWSLEEENELSDSLEHDLGYSESDDSSD